MKAFFIAATVVLSTASPAAAEVVSATADSFILRFSAPVSADPERIYTAIGQVGLWWDGGHTYSGSAVNMTMDLKPGGCFCEALPGGGIAHGEVIAAWPERMVRLNAPLGPLQATDPAAVLTFSWSQPTEGEGRTLTATYAVTGAGVGALAQPVDGVMGIQFDRLARFIEAGR